MAWENVEQRLGKRLPEQISFPAGKVWLPAQYINVDNWLSQIAENEQERKILAFGGMEFLRHRWPFQVLVEMDWNDLGATNQAEFKIETMSVGERSYIFLSKPGEHQVVAAIEPSNTPELLSAVVKILLSNPDAIAEPPARALTLRPDLVPQIVIDQAFGQRSKG